MGLRKLLLATWLVFSLCLICLCGVMFTVNDSEVVDCGYAYTLLLSSLLQLHDAIEW